METGIEETLKKINAIGLYLPGLEEKLKKYHEDPINNLELTIYKEFSGQQIRFELYISMDNNNGRIKLTGYDLLLPRIYPPIEHQVNNGFNSQELEKRMKAMDWSKHPGSFFGHRNNEEWLKMDEIMQDLDRFKGIDEDWFTDRFWEIHNITAALVARYLTGTRLANALMINLPYSRGTFYDMYPFPPNTHASVGGNSINNLVELNKLSEKAMNSYAFTNQLRKAAGGEKTIDKIPGYRR